MACSDPSVFKERLREACEAKGTTVTNVLRSTGVSPRRAIAIEAVGLRELDIHRLLQIADKLDVSVDWLTGRTGRRDIAF
jgi:transcriptional regulator with XRE-family HTH domain